MPNNQKAARLKLAERDAALALADVEYEPVDDPIGTLADIAGQARALLELLMTKVAGLDEWRYTSDSGAEQLRSEVVLLERAMDRAAKLVEALAKLGFEERRVELAERDRRYFIAVVRAAMDLMLDELAVAADRSALETVRRDRLPDVVRRAIETTSWEAC